MTEAQAWFVVFLAGGVLFHHAASEWRHHWLRHRGVKDAWRTYSLLLRHPKHWSLSASGGSADEMRAVKRRFFSERPILRAVYWSGLILFWVGILGWFGILSRLQPQRLVEWLER